MSGAVSEETSETSARSEPALSLSSNRMPFTGFFASAGDDRSAAVRNGLGDRISARTGHGVPRLKSMLPPSLNTSPPYADAALSPSSFFALPPGLSPSVLLDSPVLLSASNNLPSPTTGTFPIMNFNGNNNTSSHISQQKEIKSDHNAFPEFSFQPQTHHFTTSYGLQSWGYLDSPEPDLGSPDRTDAATELNSVQSFSTRAIDPNVEHSQQNQSLHDNQKFEDGYNWRKYGQKQVKGSENPRSYYKCTYPNCPIKKKVERSFDGRITEIVIRGAHNHPKPQSIRKSSSSSSASSAVIQSCSAQSHDTSRVMGRIDPSPGMLENSSVSNGDFEHTIRRSSPECDEVDEAEEPDVKRWKSESGGHEGISVMGSRTVRQPRVVVQTISDVDILEDGYRWRKYGQKVVKGNPNPRSYYKCTSSDCQVRKHVERAPHDLRSVITTYEGKHNHDVPPARSRITPYLIHNIDDSEITCSENYSRPRNFSSLYTSLDHYDHPLVSRVKDEPRDEFFVDTFFA